MTNFLFGDFISCLNNAKRLHLKTINIRNTKLNLNLLIILKKMGLIRGFKFLDNIYIEVVLKYINNSLIFKNLKVLSIPSKRIYIDLIKLKKLKDKSNTSIYIISTNKGLKVDLECILENLAGELLLKIEL